MLPAFLLWLAPAALQAQNTPELDENSFGAIEARHIGPAVMSGRISALDAVNSDPRIVYVGAASGGVWKSHNAGTTFKPVFDEHNQSIGAIAIDQARPDTVWVGTGEVWVRNSVSVGDGIYKTTDGGKKWAHLGLKGTERIAKIIIHPENPDIVYVAAMGPLWAPGTERGVYKTSDGGKTWEKVFYLNENTGCSDLAMDPENPDHLYAGMWNFRRQPHFFRSGGPGSGLYRSRDGGGTWQKVEVGLPKGTIGRVSIAISPANPKIIWALLETEKTALYRSGDRGETWALMNNEPAIGERPFYFSLLVADPADSNRIYKPGFQLHVSDNGGKNFQYPYVDGGNVHSDLHALYISPKDNNFLYLGTDGGLYVSHDRGNTWQMKRNLPLSQFYRISIDNSRPYNVYGGLQDNGSWYGPSRSPGGINNHDWHNVGFGDGFNVLCDPDDPNILYWQYQGGQIKRFYKDSREFKDIKPFADNTTGELRFNWNTPVTFGASGLIYVGAQYLFCSADRGDNWQRISPDLTTDDPAKQQQEATGGLTIDNSSAENHCTIHWISESPLDPNIIWAGTDDGNLQLTTTGGMSWTNTTVNIPATQLPPGTWCSYVESSPYDPGTAFATFDGHRTGDMKPYLFKTEDFGKTWSPLAKEKIEGFCHVIRQDPVNPDLLFLGTEAGLYVSIDDGNDWVRFKGNLPKVPVHDLVIHPETHDLVIGTHGRGIMIIDDLTPIRQIKAEMLGREVVFLESRPFELGFTGNEQRMEGDDAFTGKNPPETCIISYYLSKRHVFGEMNLEIYDARDSLIKILPAGKRKGINRVNWVMDMDPPKVPPSVQILGQALSGPTYPPGNYRIRIVKGDQFTEGMVKVIWDPSSKHTDTERDIRHEKLMLAYSLLEDLAYTDRLITGIRDQAGQKTAVSKSKSTRNLLIELAEKMDQWHAEIVPVKEGQITGEIRLRERLGDIYSGIMSYQGIPTRSQTERLDLLQAEVARYGNQISKVIGAELPGINQKLEGEGLDEIKVISMEEYRKEK